VYVRNKLFFFVSTRYNEDENIIENVSSGLAVVTNNFRDIIRWF